MSGYYVSDPERFGVVEFDENGKGLSIEEKQKEPMSNYAVTGLYFCPAYVSARAKQVKPSAREVLEIIALNEMYLNDRLLFDRDKMMESAKAYRKSPYGEHLKAVAEGKVKY